MAKHLWCAEAAKQLGIPTREVIRLMYMGDLRYKMIDGIAHIPEDALEEYKQKQHEDS